MSQSAARPTGDRGRREGAGQAAGESEGRAEVAAARAHLFRALFLLALGTLIAGFGGMLVYVLDGEREARRSAARTAEILSDAQGTLRLGLDAETGQRGYLLTGDPAYLEPYDVARREWSPAIARLSAAVRSEPVPDEVEEALRRIDELARRKLAELSRTVALVETGRRAEALNVVDSDLGQRVMNDFRMQLRVIVRAERKALTRASEKALAIERWVAPILTVLAFGIVVLMLFGLRLERRTNLIEAEAREARELRAARTDIDLLVRELNHRVKNLFAVILSLISLAGRKARNPEEALATIRDRVHALALAHAVTQGNIDSKTVNLRELLLATLEPYRDHGDRAARIAGPDLDLPVRMVTPLGLIMHELATNACKYGSLSSETGTLDVCWRVTGDGHAATVELEWREAGGPTVSAAGDDGFGTLLATQSARQLGGSFERHWESGGLYARLAFPLPEDTPRPAAKSGKA